MYVYIYPIIPKAHGCIQKKKRAANGNEKKKIHSDVQNSTIHRSKYHTKAKGVT